EIDRRQREKLARIKAERDPSAVAASLATIERASRGSDNLLPHIVAAVKVYASVGEICGVLRGVFGKYKPPSTL
ncbi:MAG: methylmalonyl-CoA mutase, partial [Cyanobacteria bacterium REEB65]|nr:methylmalonyl-CoA mutase [Cyanobacteria bacterium REEB65]